MRDSKGLKGRGGVTRHLVKGGLAGATLWASSPKGQERDRFVVMRSPEGGQVPVSAP